MGEPPGRCHHTRNDNTHDIGNVPHTPPASWADAPAVRALSAGYATPRIPRAPTPWTQPNRTSRTTLQDEPAPLAAHPHSHQAQLLQPTINRHIRSRKGSIRHVGASQRLKYRNLNHRAGPDPMPTPPPTPQNAKSPMTGKPMRRPDHRSSASSPTGSSTSIAVSMTSWLSPFLH